ncbi:MAG: FaeA/PapI family transcriptional regulator [Methanothrix sp.]|nr:FaeA/PapI family transcriptional regulator [Methanothrix sp.]
MTSYKERILEVIRDSEAGLTTVDVARKAGVSKTTVIKYLSILSSEHQVEFVEVGPSKLWRIRGPGTKRPETPAQDPEVLPLVEIDLCDGEDRPLSFSFRVKQDRICSLMRRARRCIYNATENCSEAGYD